ncbi:choice-of-anchor M domain-containing protein [Mariniluteicoccus flavus]
MRTRPRQRAGLLLLLLVLSLLAPTSLAYAAPGPEIPPSSTDPAVTERIERGAKLVLHRVQGPGAFHVFLQNGFDPPQPLWAGGGPDGQEIWVDTNTHTHANWVFGKPGVYLVDFSVVAQGRDGRAYESRSTLRFAVGDAVGADEVWASRLPTTTAAPVAAAPPPAPEEPFGTTMVAILVAAGVLLALGALALVHTIRSGRARAAALREEPGDE